MCKSLLLRQLKIVCFFGRSDWAGHVSMFVFRQHRRAAEPVSLDELYGQGILFSAAYYLAFSQLFGPVLLLACTGFSAWSSVNSFCDGV